MCDPIDMILLISVWFVIGFSLKGMAGSIILLALVWFVATLWLKDIGEAIKKDSFVKVIILGYITGGSAVILLRHPSFQEAVSITLYIGVTFLALLEVITLALPSSVAEGEP